MAYNVIIGVTNYTIQGGATQPSNDDAWQAQIDTAGAGTFEDINSIWAPDEPGIGAVQIPNCPAGTIRLLMNPVNEHTGGDLWLESAWTLDVPDGNGVWPGTFQNQDFSPEQLLGCLDDTDCFFYGNFDVNKCACNYDITNTADYCTTNHATAHSGQICTSDDDCEGDDNFCNASCAYPPGWSPQDRLNANDSVTPLGPSYSIASIASGWPCDCTGLVYDCAITTFDDYSQIRYACGGFSVKDCDGGCQDVSLFWASIGCDSEGVEGTNDFNGDGNPDNCYIDGVLDESYFSNGVVNKDAYQLTDAVHSCYNEYACDTPIDQTSNTWDFNPAYDNFKTYIEDTNTNIVHILSDASGNITYNCNGGDCNDCTGTCVGEGNDYFAYTDDCGNCVGPNTDCSVAENDWAMEAALSECTIQDYVSGDCCPTVYSAGVTGVCNCLPNWNTNCNVVDYGVTTDGDVITCNPIAAQWGTLGYDECANCLPESPDIGFGVGGYPESCPSNSDTACNCDCDIFDECGDCGGLGVCDGASTAWDGSNEGACCDCDGNVLDQCGVCNGSTDLVGGCCPSATPAYTGLSDANNFCCLTSDEFDYTSTNAFGLYCSQIDGCGNSCCNHIKSDGSGDPDCMGCEPGWANCNKCKWGVDVGGLEYIEEGGVITEYCDCDDNIYDCSNECGGNNLVDEECTGCANPGEGLLSYICGGAGSNGSTEPGEYCSCESCDYRVDCAGTCCKPGDDGCLLDFECDVYPNACSVNGLGTDQCGTCGGTSYFYCNYASVPTEANRCVPGEDGSTCPFTCTLPNGDPSLAGYQCDCSLNETEKYCYDADGDGIGYEPADASVPQQTILEDEGLPYTDTTYWVCPYDLDDDGVSDPPSSSWIKNSCNDQYPDCASDIVDACGSCCIGATIQADCGTNNGLGAPGTCNYTTCCDGSCACTVDGCNDNTNTSGAPVVCDCGDASACDYNSATTFHVQADCSYPGDAGYIFTDGTGTGDQSTWTSIAGGGTYNCFGVCDQDIDCNYVCNGDWETQECTPFCGVADTLDIETVCSQSSADVSDCGIGGDSCTSAEESKYCNCSCDQVDCNGVCGGTAVRDECGYCSTNVSDYTNHLYHIIMMKMEMEHLV